MQLVKKLRDELQAPLTLVKSAVSAADPQGDYESALAILKREMTKRGERLVAKSSERTTSEGWVIAARSQDGETATLSVLNCETDFVAKSDKIVELARSIGRDLTQLSLKNEMQTGTSHTILTQDEVDDLDTNGTPLKQRLTEAISLFGESIKMPRAVCTRRSHESRNTALGIHCHGGPSISNSVYLGRMGALVNLVSKGKEITPSIADELAREVVAQNPESMNEFWGLEKVGDEQGRSVRQWAGEDIEVTAWTRLER